MGEDQATRDRPDFRIEVDRRAGGAVVAVAGELDLACADELEGTLRDLLEEGPVRLDLRELAFMDSSGVRALDAVLRDVHRHLWDLSIAPELRRAVRQVLEMTGMIAVLPFEPDRGREAT